MTRRTFAKGLILVATSALTFTSVMTVAPVQAAHAPALPMPAVYGGQKIGNSKSSDYRLGVYPTGGYTPYVSLKIDGTYTVGADRYNRDTFAVEITAKSWRQKWAPDTKYGGCHETGGLKFPPSSTSKVTYLLYDRDGCRHS